jgi:hypothetical protein
MFARTIAVTSVLACAAFAAMPPVSFFSSCPPGTSVCYALSNSDFQAGCTSIGGQVWAIDWWRMKFGIASNEI